METVLITGGTGMIGSALTRALVAKGYEVIILSRSAKKNSGKVHYAVWDPQNGIMNEAALRKADHIVHLAGANVGEKRWTEKRKKEIRDSRVLSGALIASSLKAIPNKVQTVLCSSAIGFYGDDVHSKKQGFTETDPPAQDFLATVVQEWEGAIRPVEDLGKRLVIFRTGIVLSTESGAYPEFVKPLRFGIASVLGTGRQVVSWIHIDDLVRLYLEAISNPQWKGVYNAVAPFPVTNRELVLQLAKTRNRISLPVPVPAFVLKTILGEMSVEVLKSATVHSSRVEQQGFIFIFPTIETAIRKLVAS